MKQKRITLIVVVVAILIFLFLAGRYGFTVVTIAEVEQAIQSETFNPVTYVDGIWSSKLLPTFDQKSVELSAILSEMQPDTNGTVAKDSLNAIVQKYGLVTVGEAHVYMVKGKGKVVNVNADTSLGTAELTLEGYRGPIKVLLYIGTRIPSDESSVRDGVGFITFGDFKEQTEYGKVAAEINKRVLTQVLSSLDKNNLVGKTLTFKGAFNIRTFNLVQIDLKEIHVVPVEVQVGD